MTATPDDGGGRPRGRARAALPSVLLTLGSLVGVGLVMAGLLMYLAPTPHTATPHAATPGPPAALSGPGGPEPDASGVGGAQAAGEDIGAARTATAGATRDAGTGGGGAAGGTAPEGAVTDGPSVPDAPSLRRSEPTRVKIPRIGVDAPLTSVGVLKSGEIQVPPLDRPGLAGWYRLGPTPGEHGPAVILGHVNTRRGPAVFSRLRELTRGDQVAVTRADGSTAVFTVDGTEQASKSRFPTKKVYGHVDNAALRLITCGGIFNPRSHSYTDNIIVYATLSSGT
ncbi:class F sortase [Sphaerisporangium sp. B11E5]|uniref:class F sortase n=1 Tax=Sphaerisporangium sp. B11E5 TaxID=3153563 RepID=UPI00325CB75F